MLRRPEPFQGDVSDYEEFRRKELGTAVDQRHRIGYKRLDGGVATARATSE